LPTWQHYKIVKKNSVLLHLVGNIGNKDDETRPIINKPNHPKKKGEYKEMEGPMSKKTKKNHLRG
jgi:hypothetical protein